MGTDSQGEREGGRVGEVGERGGEGEDEGKGRRRKRAEKEVWGWERREVERGKAPKKPMPERK